MSFVVLQMNVGNALYCMVYVGWICVANVICKLYWYGCC